MTTPFLGESDFQRFPESSQKNEFAKNPGRRKHGEAPFSIYPRLIPRACAPNPRVLRETSREI
jgi:hypothetical protein